MALPGASLAQNLGGGVEAMMAISVVCENLARRRHIAITVLAFLGR